MNNETTLTNEGVLFYELGCFVAALIARWYWREEELTSGHWCAIFFVSLAWPVIATIFLIVSPTLLGTWLGDLLTRRQRIAAEEKKMCEALSRRAAEGAREPKP